jgi:dipeptide/tripeptide permease
VYKTYGRVSIGVGVVFLFAGALDVRGHFGVWAASSIMFGLFLIVFGTSFLIDTNRQKARRRLSLWFLVASLVLLAIAVGLFRS